MTSSFGQYIFHIASLASINDLNAGLYRLWLCVACLLSISTKRLSIKTMNKKLWVFIIKRWLVEMEKGPLDSHTFPKFLFLILTIQCIRCFGYRNDYCQHGLV